MSLPRVLLVEDNLSLQHFVRSAFADLPIELHCCDHVDEALALLREAPAALVLTDLMMPGRSGYDLIQCLADEPALQGPARLVVFSAGLNNQVRSRLAQPHIWRLLAKPCSLAELQACVEDVLAELAAPKPRPAAQTGEQAAAPRESAHTLNAMHAISTDQVIARNFGGDRDFYEKFHRDCLKQFDADIAAGNQACELNDGPGLRRVAHSLKSVLLILGLTAASELARQLEQATALAQWRQAGPAWQELQQILRALQAAAPER